MKINEVERMLKISRLNIKFYEREILLIAEHEKYSEKNIIEFKKILILRKCNISIEDIKSLFNKNTTLKEVTTNQISKIDENMVGSKTLCKKLSLETKDFDKINVDKYMKIIEKEEDKNNKFYNISKDYTYTAETVKNDLFNSDSKINIKKIFLTLYVLLLFSIFCVFDIVIYGQIDMIENVTMTIIFTILDYLFVEAFINDKNLKLNTKFYIINLIIVILSISLYNFVKFVSNKYADVNENVLDFSVSATLIKISREKYKDRDVESVYAQSHQIIDSYEKDGKIYTYIVAKYGEYIKKNNECESVNTTSEPMTMIFDKVKNGSGAYNLNEYKENEIPDKYKDKLNVDYNSKFFKDQTDKYCQNPYFN